MYTEAIEEYFLQASMNRWTHRTVTHKSDNDDSHQSMVMKFINMQVHSKTCNLKCGYLSFVFNTFPLFCKGHNNDVVHSHGKSGIYMYLYVVQPIYSLF